MAIWLKCPECNGQGAYPSSELLLGKITLPFACWPLRGQLEQDFSRWLSIHVFTRHFKKVGYKYQFKSDLVALECHSCGGHGFVPASNFCFCAQEVHHGVTFRW